MTTKSSARLRLGAWITAGVLGGGIVTGIVVSQLGVATAAAPTPSPSASAQPRPDLPAGGPMLRFGPGRGPGPGMGLRGHVLHGEATVEARDGTTKVAVTQTGDITDIAASTITVTSTDGFEATYTVDKDTHISINGSDGAMSSLSKGDTVHVMGTKDGSTRHADAVLTGRPPMADSGH